jgi:hypothetical protein
LQNCEIKHCFYNKCPLFCNVRPNHL